MHVSPECATLHSAHGPLVLSIVQEFAEYAAMPSSSKGCTVLQGM